MRSACRERGLIAWSATPASLGQRPVVQPADFVDWTRAAALASYPVHCVSLSEVFRRRTLAPSLNQEYRKGLARTKCTSRTSGRGRIIRRRSSRRAGLVASARKVWQFYRGCQPISVRAVSSIRRCIIHSYIGPNATKTGQAETQRQWYRKCAIVFGSWLDRVSSKISFVSIRVLSISSGSSSHRWSSSRQL